MVLRSFTVYALVIVTLVLAASNPVENANILAVMTNSGKSHCTFMSAVLRSLTDAGHRVTVFTPFPEGDRENYTEVDTSKNMPIRYERDLMEMMDNMRLPVRLINMVTSHSRSLCNSVYRNRRLGEMVRAGRDGNGRRFDAIFTEPVVVDCASYLAHAFDAPLIHAIPSPMITFVERSSTGYFPNPACVSHITAGHAVPETFVQRSANAALWTYSVLKLQYDVWTMRLADPRPYDSSPKVVPSIVFQNTHRITESPRPVPPNLVEVGGIHLLKPPKDIPKDILDFIDHSPHGVIYFTFGSLIKLSTLPKHIEKAFKNVLSKIPQKVLWKYETEMEDMPKNVMVRKWFPQREILLHPKVKLFISHGGISGVYEAVDAGVPVLGFPLFYDQPRNLEHLVRAEMAITMDLLNTSEDMLFNAISELIHNEKYMKNAKFASNRFKDRPMSPAQSVVYWTEYVIRHKGAPHLKYHALNLTWYQYFLLDVICSVFICIFLVLYILYKIIKRIICMSSQMNKVKAQ